MSDTVLSNGGVRIVKASAGSGKTYALAREYIRLLLSDGAPDAHRHILAVTFTNKATGEMKKRILKELDILSRRPEDSPYRSDLLPLEGIGTDEALRRKAFSALSGILRDYGGFSVSTIDSFFQQALRAFAREAGEFREYQIELDKDSLVEETVDRVLDSLSDKDRDLLKWLSDTSMESLESGEGYHLESRLSEFAADYSKDSFVCAEKENGIDRERGFSEDNLRSLTEICRKVEKDFDTGYIAAIGELSTCLESYTDIVKGLSGFLGTLRSYKPGGKVETKATAYWLGSVEDGSAAFTAAGRKKYGHADFDRVREAVSKVNAYWGKPLREVGTARLLKKQVSMFRVASAIDREFKELLKEKNILSIDVTNTILNDIIGGTEAPFIYEKLGVRYSHFLLDEFQDTARIQWDNFRPLLAESISRGCSNLVVGDVKQSIYRWRNADWKILKEDVSAQLPRCVEKHLESNYRSAPGVIDFNNAFFSALASDMDDTLDDGLRTISEIYSDVKQEHGKTFPVGGSVEMTFCPADEIFDRTVSEVVSCHCERGFRYKDIAVIVRTNAMGSEVATRLVAGGIPVVSNDSLHIGSAPCVRRLVCQMYAVDNPDEKVRTFYAGDFDRSAALRSNTLVGMADRLLSAMSPEEVNRDTLYLLAFMDLLRDFTSRNGNSLHAFLKYWESDGISRNISSPSGSDAVTIITVHKVKGLDYPCVILPVPKRNDFVSGREKSWECPPLEGTAFGDAEKMLYSVTMTGGLENTFFRENWLRNVRMAYTDSINLWYVAMTRASEAMHIVSPFPSKEVMEGGQVLKNISAALYRFANGSMTGDAPDHYVYGTLSPAIPRIEADSSKMTLRFATGTVSDRAGLHISSDASEFFSEDRGVSDRRTRGTVLHGILQNVCTPSDLDAALGMAVSSGALDPSSVEETRGLLFSAIASVNERGWFPSDRSKVLKERDILDASGNICRPDRVVITPHGTDVIDYKFGHREKRYESQVRRYVELCKALGMREVRGYIWYVGSGDIDPV